jgi:CheY-like chemotaxis protein
MTQAPPSRQVLIVDDQVSYRSRMVRLVEELGYRVLWAEDGRQARQQVETHPEELDLVFLDLSMPPTNDAEEGLEALQRIKELAPDLPVVVMSSYLILASEARRLGALDFIEKNTLAPRRVAEILERMFGSTGAQTDG